MALIDLFISTCLIIFHSPKYFAQLGFSPELARLLLVSLLLVFTLALIVSVKLIQPRAGLYPILFFTHIPIVILSAFTVDSEFLTGIKPLLINQEYQIPATVLLFVVHTINGLGPAAVGTFLEKYDSDVFLRAKCDIVIAPTLFFSTKTIKGVTRFVGMVLVLYPFRICRFHPLIVPAFWTVFSFVCIFTTIIASKINENHQAEYQRINFTKVPQVWDAYAPVYYVMVPNILRAFAMIIKGILWPFKQIVMFVYNVICKICTFTRTTYGRIVNLVEEANDPRNAVL